MATQWGLLGASKRRGSGMNNRNVFLLSAAVLASVFSLTVAWEFAIEEVVAPGVLDYHREENVQERWEYVVTSSVFAALALILPTLWLARMTRERERGQQALEESEQRFRDFAGIAADWFWEMGPDLRFTFISERLEAIAGVAPHQIVGLTREEFLGDQIEDGDAWRRHRRDLEAHRAFTGFEYPWRRPDGKLRVLCVSGKPLFDGEGRFRGYRGVGSDVTAARRMVNRIAHRAAHDPLTGLLNRREFERRLEHAIASARRHGSRHVVCYLDLDRFKTVNDTAGHAAGDALLKEVRGLLAGKFRERDTLARLGGDEFGLLLENCAVDEALEKCEGIISAFRDFRLRWNGHTFRVGVSIGLAPVGPDAEDASDVLRRADVACYAAKELGRNRVDVYGKTGSRISSASH
jgi:diguanylate cyclase (GGDEF)-like protein/PAS domain S-box-containing protein